MGNTEEIREEELQVLPYRYDDGVDVRYGGLGFCQLGAAAAHYKLDSSVAYLMKVLCSQEIYWYAFMEMGLDSPDLPMGMFFDLHLKRRLLLEFKEGLANIDNSNEKADIVQLDFSNRWFTLMHSSRPFIIRNIEELADHAAAVFETIQDINVGSRIIRDTTDSSTLDDPLPDRYKRLGCSATLLDKESEDYKMILIYLEKTYEPVQVGEASYVVALGNVYAIETKEGP